MMVLACLIVAHVDVVLFHILYYTRARLLPRTPHTVLCGPDKF